ncbi:ThiF family adenylyltransferase [Nannocystaceae bacterium ST9]
MSEPTELPFTAPRSGLLTLRKPERPNHEPGSSGEPTHEQTSAEETYRLHRRFDRMGRLVGDPGMHKLFASHVMVVGLGGVGSWAAEALARSGVGRLSLVDFDLVCVTNTNRQLHAMRGTTGKPKATVLAERLRQIHPSASIEDVREFYEAATSEALLARKPDLIVDAIDNLSAKAHLVARARELAIPIVVSGGASGRMDPTQIRIGDLGRVEGDPFLKMLRKLLRRHHGFPTGREWGIASVHSLEEPADPIALAYDAGEGFRCVCPQGDNGKHSCDQRSLIYGTAGFVTGSFGFACASQAVRMLLG